MNGPSRILAGLVLAAAASLAGAQEAAPPKVADIGPLHYPEQARREGAEGVVLVAVRVLESGSAGEVRLARSSGHKLLDAEALRLAQGARYTPAQRAGQPVDTWVQLPIRFELRDEPPAPKASAPVRLAPEILP